VFQIGDDTGAHPVTYYKAFNYDLGKHAPITFDTLFKPGTKPLGVIYPAVRRELQERSGYDVLPPERGGLDVDTYQNFAITDDAVIFFFGAGPVLGPMDLGKAAVPRTQLASLLASP
jgi:hypothetical protein